MSDCCSTTSNAACSVPQSKPGMCPVCGAKGRPVQILTVKSLVREHWAVAASGTFSFCRAPDCDVVYFSNEAIFRKPDVKVRVGIKEKDDPVPLCYCFDYTRADIRTDIEERFATEILERVKAEVEGGFCACETKNPSGACCLGEITRAIQEAKTGLAAAAAKSR